MSDVELVVEVDPVRGPPTTDPPILERRLEQHRHHILLRYAERREVPDDRPVELPLRVHRASGERRDLDQRVALGVTGRDLEPSRLVLDQPLGAIVVRDPERLDEGVSRTASNSA